MSPGVAAYLPARCRARLVAAAPSSLPLLGCWVLVAAGCQHASGPARVDGSDQTTSWAHVLAMICIQVARELRVPGRPGPGRACSCVAPARATTPARSTAHTRNTSATPHARSNWWQHNLHAGGRQLRNVPPFGEVFPGSYPGSGGGGSRPPPPVVRSLPGVPTTSGGSTASAGAPLGANSLGGDSPSAAPAAATRAVRGNSGGSSGGGDLSADAPGGFTSGGGSGSGSGGGGGGSSGSSSTDSDNGVADTWHLRRAMGTALGLAAMMLLQVLA